MQTMVAVVIMQAYVDAVYFCIVFNVLSVMILTPAIGIFCIFRCDCQLSLSYSQTSLFGVSGIVWTNAYVPG